jgi:hypothetical protein
VKLTKEERDVMEHVVTDPDGWLDHVVKTFGEAKAREFLDAKVARWKPEYEEKKKEPGYKNRIARDAEEAERQKPMVEAMQKEGLIRAEIDRLFRGQAIINLKARGENV